MPISFLNPGLLFGLVAASVPLILHLLRNRRIRKVRFPDLRLLREAKASQSRSVGLRRWLLLLLRMLAIMLIVLGAARPRVGGVGSADGDRVSMLMILDASASMQAVNEGGSSRFARALDEARTIADGLVSGSEIQWIVAGSAPETMFGDWLPTSVLTGRTFDDTVAGDGACDLIGALQLAAELAVDAAYPLSVVLFSDLQPPRSTLEELGVAAAALRNVDLRSFSVREIGEELVDGAVLDVSVPLHAVMAGESCTIEATVRSSHADQIVRLDMDGTFVAEAVAPGGSGEVSQVRFALRAPTAGLHLGRVVTEGDRLAVDDRMPFVLRVHDRIRVLLVHGRGRDVWRYLAHALAPDYSRETDTSESVDLQVSASDAWETGDLERRDVLILADPDPLGREKIAGIRLWLEAGGRVWLMIGDPARRQELTTHLLPEMIGSEDLEFHLRSEAGAEHLRIVAPEHPVFADLPAPSLQTLEEALWRRNWVLSMPESVTLAQLEGGDAILLGQSRGQGRILVMTSALDADATDLATNAMFPPLAQRLVGWLVADDESRSVAEAGVPLQILLGADITADIARGLVFSFQPAGPGSDGRTEMSAGVEWLGRRPRVSGPTRPRSGFWTLRAGGDTLTTVATVVPEVELRSDRLAPAEFAALLQQGGIEVDATLKEATAAEVGHVLAGRSLSGWCFLAAVLILLLETRLSRGRNGVAKPVGRT